MSGKWKRNVGKHTDAETAGLRIIMAAASHGYDAKAAVRKGRLMVKSQMGYWAFPDYNFGRPQGAAFSVAKIVSDLEKRGLLQYYWNSELDRQGYYVTAAGERWAKENV